MWLSRRIVQETPETEPATLGTVTIGGADSAVVTDAEKRSARLIAPGGYCWQPKADDSVLVVRGNELYVAGKLQEGEELQPDEVKIFSDGAEIRLKNDGKIEIRGTVRVTGELYVNGRKVRVE